MKQIRELGSLPADAFQKYQSTINIKAVCTTLSTTTAAASGVGTSTSTTDNKIVARNVLQ